jgi:hypothetical protein
MVVMAAAMALFVVAAWLAGKGIRSILSAFEDNARGAAILLGGGGKAIGGSLEGIALVMWSIVDAPWSRFAAAARGVASGLGTIFRAVSFAMAGRGMLDSTINSLIKFINFITSLHGSKATMIKDMDDIAAALLRLTMAVSWMKMLGGDKLVHSLGIMTVKPALEDKQKESADKKAQIDALTDIKKSVDVLNKTVQELDFDEKRGQEIMALLRQWLPEIAEGNKGLASATNAWQSSMG